MLKLIKLKFLETVTLHHPNFEQQFYLNCDASDVSLGAELYQEDKDGHHLVISFASTILNSCERNYNVTEKEIIIQIGFSENSVSYTHLDVYKRQLMNSL